MIYFMQSVDGGSVKIGSSGNVDRRIRQLESYYGTALVVLATMEGGKAEERKIHQRFARFRFGRTEQFRPTPELMAFIGLPLFVNQGDVELMEGVQDRTTVINLKGPPEDREWFEQISRKTMIPSSRIVRAAVKEWAEKHGHPAPPWVKRESGPKK